MKTLIESQVTAIDDVRSTMAKKGKCGALSSFTNYSVVERKTKLSTNMT